MLGSLTSEALTAVSPVLYCPRTCRAQTGARPGCTRVRLGGFDLHTGGKTAQSPVLDKGDLRVTTDFRSAYGDLLEGVLDTEADRVLSGSEAGKPLGVSLGRSVVGAAL